MRVSNAQIVVHNIRIILIERANLMMMFSESRLENETGIDRLIDRQKSINIIIKLKRNQENHSETLSKINFIVLISVRKSKRK